jgi:hypothetical protein
MTFSWESWSKAPRLDSHTPQLKFHCKRYIKQNPAHKSVLQQKTETVQSDSLSDICCVIDKSWQLFILLA